MRALAANVLLIGAMCGGAISLATLAFFLWRAWCSWLLGKAEDDRLALAERRPVGRIWW